MNVILKKKESKSPLVLDLNVVTWTENQMEKRKYDLDFLFPAPLILKNALPLLPVLPNSKSYVENYFFQSTDITNLCDGKACRFHV